VGRRPASGSTDKTGLGRFDLPLSVAAGVPPIVAGSSRLFTLAAKTGVGFAQGGGELVLAERQSAAGDALRDWSLRFGQVEPAPVLRATSVVLGSAETVEKNSTESMEVKTSTPSEW
jgi:hypothetical protein